MTAHRMCRAAGLAALVVMAGCSRETTRVSGGDNLTHILLSDAPFPFDRIARADMYIVSVSASITADTGAGTSFVTLVEPHRRYNLLELQNGTTADLGSLHLAAGPITAVRVIVDTDSSSITLKDGRVLTGVSNPGIAWQSSAGRPVLYALVHEQLVVPDTGAVIAIDFELGESFIPGSNDGFVFSPILRAVDASRTGSVAGVVRSANGAPVADASLTLYIGTQATPENTWGDLQTGRTDASGAFTIPFVTPSAHWATTGWGPTSQYMLAVDPPSGSGLARAVLPVGTVEMLRRVDVGTITLP